MADLNIQILDVGQGDGIFITFPNGKTAVVDLGTSKNKSVVAPDIFKYINDHVKFKNNKLDYLFLTHPDKDHYNLIPGFLNYSTSKYKSGLNVTEVGEVYYGGFKCNYPDILWKSIKALHGTVVCLPQSFPYSFNKSLLGGCDMQILCMDVACTSKKGDHGWDKNTASLVLKISYGNNSILLTGDATIDTENYLISKYGGNLISNIIKVPHHGSSRTSNQADFYKAVNPQYAFISSDRHGTIDGDKLTGYRIPSMQTIQNIRTSPRLQKACSKHSFVVASDTNSRKRKINSEWQTITGTKAFLVRSLTWMCRSGRAGRPQTRELNTGSQ